MTCNTILLEVDKSNEAIMAYCLQLPDTPSSKYDYVVATRDELLYLSLLEDAIFAPGMVATLSDLYEHRARVAAKQAVATSLPKPTTKPTQQPSSNAIPKTTNGNAKASLIAALRKHRSRK